MWRVVDDEWSRDEQAGRLFPDKIGDLMRFFVLSFLAIMTAAGCSSHAGRDLNVVYGDSIVVDVIRNSPSVNVDRLPGGSLGIRDIVNHEGWLGPLKLTDQQASKLRSILLDRSIFGTDHPNSCALDLGIRVQFQHEGSVVDVMFCFKCGEIAVYRDGKQTQVESFERGLRQLSAFFFELFPDDAEIRLLPR